jgi:hypothetical protein
MGGEERAAGPVAGAAPVIEPLGQLLGAIAEGVRRGEDAAGSGPHTVVTDVDAHEGLEKVERSEAIGSEVGLGFDIEDVVPLGQVEPVAQAVVPRDRADLGFVEAVDLEPPVEELDGRRAGTEARHDRDCCGHHQRANRQDAHLPPSEPIAPAPSRGESTAVSPKLLAPELRGAVRDFRKSAENHPRSCWSWVLRYTASFGAL